jgi:Zn-dependent protease
VLFALRTPAAFAALVVAFLLALVLRAVAIRLTARTLGLADRHDAIAPRLREDVDPFGAVGAAIGGMGWGKLLSVDDVPRYRGRGRAAAVFLSGPLTCVLVGEALLGTYRAVFGPGPLAILPAGAVLRGLGLPPAEDALLALGVGILCFGLLALIPIPPLDGFGAIHTAMRKPGPSMQWMRLWLEEKNIGVLILLICCLFPFEYPLILRLLDILSFVFIRVWG